MLYYTQICHGIKPTHGWLNSTLHITITIERNQKSQSLQIIDNIYIYIYIYVCVCVCVCVTTQI